MIDEDIYDIEFKKTQTKLEKLTDCLSPTMRACVIYEQQRAKRLAVINWLLATALVCCVEVVLGLVYFRCLFIDMNLRLCVALVFLLVLLTYFVSLFHFIRFSIINIAFKNYPALLEFALSLLHENDIVPDRRFGEEGEEED